MEENRKREKSNVRELVEWLLYFVIVIGIMLLVITFVGQRTKVSGSSMEPTLSNGDNLIVDKLSFRFRDPKRYEIIVFPYQYKEHTYYIKRIIGMPGEKVQIKGGFVYINDQILTEHYGNAPMKSPGIAESPVYLGENEYFVLGDNRNNSADSREEDVGIITREELMGRAWIRIWPLNKAGVIVHE